MGAMLAGVNSRTAVKIATLLDPFTGGEIKTYELKGEDHELHTVQ